MRFLFYTEKSGIAILRWDITCTFLRATGRYHKSYLYIYVLRVEGSKKMSDIGSSVNLDAYSTPSSIVSIPTFPDCRKVHILSWLQSMLYLFIQISTFITPGKTWPQISALDLKSSCGTNMMANEYYLNEQHNSWPSGTKFKTGRNYTVYSQFLFSFYKPDISLYFSI